MIYKVVGLCKDGFELVSREAESFKEAKAELRLILEDNEYVASGLGKVEILNERDECIVDEFV